MKNKLSALLVALFTLSIATGSFAQDDLYYNPSDDNSETTYAYEVEESDYEAADMDEYDEYEYLDDYDYHYSSRIRRFSRPTSFGYYAPFFTDRGYYNRLITPGVSIYVGNPYSYNAYRRIARNNFFNPYGFNNFGFNNPYGRSSFYNPVGFGGGFGFNNGFNNGFSRGAVGGYNAYCPPTSYGTSRAVRGSSNATYGPRGTSTNTSRSYDSTVRRGTNRNTESVRGNSTTRSRTSGARSNSTRRTYDRSNNNTRRNYTPRSNSSSRRSYSTPRSNRSSRSYSTPRRSSSSRSFSTPSRSSSSRSIRSSSSSRRNF